MPFLDPASSPGDKLYLIGGASRSGKSMLAKQLFKKQAIPFLSLDAVVMGLTQGFPQLGIHDQLFPDDIARRLWPFTEALCANLLYVGDDYGLEGEGLLPSQARILLDRYGSRVKCCFLGYDTVSVPEKILRVKAHQQAPGDWLIGESEDRIAGHVTHMVAYSGLLRKECRANRIPYFDTSNDFKGALERAFQCLIA